MTKSSAEDGDRKPPSGLDAYRSKRDPAQTTEPFSAEHPFSPAGTLIGRYVVHQHAARRMHWDLRLQMGPALRSFAVPKGPSLDPADKRLAVHTEDHPLEYLDFEDVIPEGNYGAGAMIAWDLGQVRYIETTGEEGLARGKIDFTLHGFKLNGRFALVHTGRRRSGPDGEHGAEWLLFKKADAHSRTAERSAQSIVESLPRSVLSGLSVSELPHKAELAAKLEGRAAQLGAKRAELRGQDLTPMLCASEGAGLDDKDRLYELKLDGVRILADKHGDSVSLRYRTKRAASASYPEIARAVRALAPERVVLDGEIVTFDEHGKPSFQRLAPRIHAVRPRDVAAAQARVSVCYVVFDVLQIGERCLLEVPLASRKSLLRELLPGAGLLRALDHIEGDGRALFELCRAEALEGIVAKRARSPYRIGPSRSTDWVKIKRERDDDFVVVGWMPRKGVGRGLGALCLASRASAAELDRAPEWHYRGRVGSGFDRDTLHELQQRLDPLASESLSLSGATAADTKGMRFVRPELVVRVRFTGFTDDGRLRAPVYLGVRPDIAPEDCTAAPPTEALVEAIRAADGAARTLAPTPDATSATEPSSKVVITNRDKVFWPEEGYTKGDLCNYYAAVASLMLPFLRGRPVVLVRYPDGISGKSFYQWRVPAGTPPWIRTLELYDEAKQSRRGTGKSVFLIEDADSLLHIANLGCIPLHALAYREQTPQHCDFLTVDLDVGQRPFADAVKLALTLRELLEKLGLRGFPKTSGQKGLHVLVPLGAGVEFPTAKLLCELLGQLLVGRHPEIATMERTRSKRGPRVYVDTGQTGQSRTIVAPYSARAYPGATVSTPLAWEELHLALDPSLFTITTVPERLARSGDPMAGLLDERPDIFAAVQTLGAWLSQPPGR